MKALTLWQPWAHLVALGVKTIETRSWSTTYRGPLAIHAAARPIRTRQVVGDWEAWPPDKPGQVHPNHPQGPRPPRLYYNGGDIRHGGSWAPLTLGAVIATCVLEEVVPILGVDDPTHRQPHVTHARHDPDRLCLFHPTTGWHTNGHTPAQHDEWDFTDITDQKPYGIFTPNRYAWLLADILPLEEPQPTRGRQGLWNWSTP